LRVEPGARTSFGALIAAVRETTLGAYAHQDVPFEKLVEALAPGRSLGHAPLFQVVLALQNAPLGPLTLPGLRMEPLTNPGGTAKFDLTLSLIPGSSGLAGGLEYATDLFDRTTILRWAGAFERLLTGAVATPEGLLSELPLLSPAERQQIQEWRGERSRYPRESTLPDLFAEQAANAPDAVALVGGEESLSYGELAARVLRLAARLRGLGVGPEVPVGLFLERSPAMVVATLAVLEAGGAYVPLDPGHPAERLAGLLAATEVPVLLTQEQLLGRLPDHAAWVVLLDRGGRSAPAPEPLSAAARPAAESLAYVMFTSGSTGAPKGVAVTHRGVVRLVRGAGYARFGPEEVFLQLAPAAFDAATFEIWGALLNGGRLVIPAHGALSLAEIGETLGRHGVTTLWLTAGLFHEMVERNLAGLTSVRQLLAGGDALSPVLVERAVKGLPGTRLINGYGPTEGTTFTCCERVEAGFSGPAVPIGRAIANTEVAVVDGEGRAVPVEVAGELVAGGDGLARGYWGRPDLTAERFTPDPLSGRAGALVYRTGDRARFRADGRLEFLGRLDRQVKIRGFRIEPGEVEAALAAHPAVRQAVVVVREDRPGERRLVAYVVGAAGVDLKGYLRERLPEPMVPAVFVSLPALPLTANGKVDRQALPAPEAPVGGQERPPRTPAEEVMAGLWAEVLGIAAGGIAGRDGFFDLGGHSLLATRLVSKVREAFGVEMPLKAVFESPTLAGFTTLAERALAAGLGLEAPAIRPVPRTAPLPLSFSQERLWFLDQLEPGSAAYDIPVALHLSGRLDGAALAAALGEIVRRHETLRTTFRPGVEGPVQVIAPALDLPVPVVDLGNLTAEAGRLAAEEARRPFDLTAGPLLRALLLRLGPEAHLFVLNLHHVISDGWSMGVLVRELGESYGAFAAGRLPVLPALPVQYADYAVWQRQWLSGEVLSRQLAWWRERLAGAPEVVELPADQPRPAVQSLRGGSLPVIFPAGLSQGLAALARSRGATPFTLLLAGFGALLGRLSGQGKVVVGSPVANRTRLETEGLIGFFVNTLPLPVDSGEDPALGMLLGQVRETTLGAYAHQDLPFEKLVEAVAPRRSLAYSPLFQVMLALQNAPLPRLALPGLTAEPAGLDSRTEKFDLTLSLAEQGERLGGSLSYSLDLFERPTAARLLGWLEVLLAGVVERPEQRVSELPLLGEAERAQILREWNDTVGGVGRLVHERFAEQARLRPWAPAVTAAGETLTYGELARQAGRLARRLRALGVGPEVPVAICLGATPARVVAILAVLTAGGAYVPFDPAYAGERLAFMLADARPPVILTERALAGLLPASQATVLCLDETGPAGGAPLEREPLPFLGPDSLAYVIYTSGSTGRPKGVALRHGGLANLVGWHCSLYAVGAEDRATLVASPGFDASVWELWPYLASGASVHLVEGEARFSAAAVVRLWSERGVTLAFLPTPLAEAVLESGVPAGLGCQLRALLTGGDRLQRAPAAGSPFRLMNHYGPSEYSVVTTAGEAVAGGAGAPGGGG
ncbi:MAG: hypothetical protein QOJ16_3287, partial [Acidobacteriota bacterium]|nr:hypothetical protein [Acidobacteriota bacterium]